MGEMFKAFAQVARLRGREATLVQQLQQAERRPRMGARCLIYNRRVSVGASQAIVPLPAEVPPPELKKQGPAGPCAAYHESGCSMREAVAL